MEENKIIIKGAKVHNLKNVSLELPKNQIIAFTGVSGSGKSSLAFDTIFAEGQRRYIESLSPYARQFLGQMERADVDEIVGLSPAIAIDQRALSHNPRSTVGTLTEIYDYLRVLFSRLGEMYCPICGARIEKLTLEEIVDAIKIQSGDLPITILSPVVRGRKGEYYQLFYDFLSLGFSEVRVNGKFRSLHEKLVLDRYKQHNIDILIDKVLAKEESRLFEDVESALDHSKGLVTVIIKDKEMTFSSKATCPNDNFSFSEMEPRLFSFNSPYGACPACYGLGKSDIFSDEICPSCKGKRLKPEALSVKIKGKNIDDIVSMTIEKNDSFFENYESAMTIRQKTIAHDVVKEIKDRLNFLLQVGLNYLSLKREAESLSGGEAQRIRLASQIGSQLSNTLYVLDEPTIGLHERDTYRLINTLKSLKERRNTIIVVEHDEKTVIESDFLADLGPMAGEKGGEITAAGPTASLIKNAGKYNSLTLNYLSGKEKIVVPEKRRASPKEKIKIIGARANNLKNANIEVPLRKLVCLTGVSGSGKSSFLYDVLYKNLAMIKNPAYRQAGRVSGKLIDASKITGSEYVDKLAVISQSPIGRTPRSNPATYTGIFSPIRDFYSQLEESRQRGYSASRFSFNRPGGRCEACGGAGYNLIEMHFLPPVLVQCEICHGKRFNRETLQIKYKKKNISEILDMTVDEASEFFENIYSISDKLKILQSVGLGYIRLGQSATTLSGGEAQRIRLGRELTSTLGKRTLYLLDEPTVGLHYNDIKMLLSVLNKLVDRGNSVVLIEHNMHIIKSADYIIDLGPEAGEGGGKLVAQGTPEEIAENKKSITGQYLKDYLK